MKTSDSRLSDPLIQDDKSIDEVGVAKKEVTKIIQPEGHVDKAPPPAAFRSVEKSKLSCASPTKQPDSSLEPHCEGSFPEEPAAGEVKKKSHKRKRPSPPNKDRSENREAHDNHGNDSGNTTGITDLKDVGNVPVSTKISLKASGKRKREEDNTIEVTSDRSAYIIFVMEEGTRVKKENKLDNIDVVKVRERF